eukprot:5339792-Lingulodinium_polyedra.AAC.1
MDWWKASCARLRSGYTRKSSITGCMDVETAFDSMGHEEMPKAVRGRGADARVEAIIRREHFDIKGSI